MEQPAALLEIDALEVRYGTALALEDVSLTVALGRSVAILGPNGVGKSTLARAISGLVPVTNGTINFEGRDISKAPAHRRRRQGIIYLPEGRGVFPALTVMENLRMAASQSPRAERRSAIDRAFTVFEPLAARRNAKAGTLSGGEQQMLSLARAIAVDSKLVIADEMSLGLAPKMVDVVFDGLLRLKKQGITILIIEQFVHRALAFSDECVLLSRGQVTWAGSALDADDEVLASYLGSEVPAVL